MATSLRDAMIQPNFPEPTAAERDAIPGGRPEVPLSALIEELKAEGVEWDKLDERQQRAAIVYFNDELGQRGLSVRGESRNFLRPSDLDPNSPYGVLSAGIEGMFAASPLTDRIEKIAGAPAVSYAEGEPGPANKMARGVGGIFGMLSNVALSRGALSGAGLGGIASGAGSFAGYEAAQALSEGEKDPAVIAGRAAAGGALGGLFEAAPIARRALTSRMGKTGEAVEKFAESGLGKNLELAGLGAGFTALQPDAEFEDYLINALSLPIGAKILGVLAGGGGRPRGSKGEGDSPGRGGERPVEVRYELPSGEVGQAKATPEATKAITSYVSAKVQEPPRTVARALGRPDMRIPAERPRALEPPKISPPGLAPPALAPPGLPAPAADLPATRPVAQAEAAAEKPQTILDKIRALQERSTIDRDLSPEALMAQEASGVAYDGTSSFEGTYGQALFEQGAQTPLEARRRRMEESRRERERIQEMRKLVPDTPVPRDAAMNESLRAMVAESGVSAPVREAVREFGVERLDSESIYVMSHADGGLNFLVGEGLTKADVLGAIFDVRSKEAGAEFREQAGRTDRAAGDVTLRSFGSFTKQDFKDIADGMKAVGRAVRNLIKRTGAGPLPEFTPLEDVPLDKAVSIYRRTGRWDDLMSNLPQTLEPSPNFVTRLATLDDALRGTYAFGGRNYLLQAASGGVLGGGPDAYIGWVNRNIDEAQVLWSDHTAQKMVDLLERYDIKPGSGKDHQLSRLAGNEKTQDLDVVKDMRSLYDSIYHEVNQMRSALGLPLVPYRQNYISHMRRKSILDSVAEVFGENFGDIAERVSVKDIKNPHAKKQVEKYLNSKKHLTSASEIMRRYIAVAAKDIFHNLAIAYNKPHIEAMRSAGLKNSADQVAEYTAVVYGNRNPAATRFINNMGGESPTAQAAFKASRFTKKRLNQAVFMTNIKWMTTTQPLSAIITLHKTNPAAAVEAFGYMLDPKFRKFCNDFIYSYRVKKRSGGGLVDQDWSDKNTVLLSKRLSAHKNLDRIGDFAAFFGSAMERALTMHAVAAAISHGRAMGIRSPRDLLEYASDIGGQTQTFYDYKNRAGLLQSSELSSTVLAFSSGLFEIINTAGETTGRTGYHRTNVFGEISSRSAGLTGTDLVPGDVTSGGGRMSSQYKDLVVQKKGSVASKMSKGQSQRVSKRAALLMAFIAEQMVAMWIRDQVSGTGMNPAELHPVYRLFLNSDYPKIPVAAEIDGFIRAVNKAIKYGNLKPMARWFVRWTPAGVQTVRTAKALDAIDKDGWVYSDSGNRMYRIDTDSSFELFKALTTGVETTEAGREYYNETKFITVPVKKKKAKVVEDSGGLSERGHSRGTRRTPEPSRSGR